MRLSKRIDVIAPSLLKDYFRNAPLVDFMAPTIKVNQIILPNVVDDVNFIRVAKMDRCQTCHLAIDKKGYEKYPQPYTTHPKLELYLGGSSAHPIDRVGCTVCHEGMGQSVSFRDAAHAPGDEKQKEEWEKQYDWEQPHLWDYPMLPTKMTEASCAKCHKQQVYVPWRREPRQGVRDLRTRWLLRVPQDQGLRHEHPQAGPDPHEDRFEADGRIG